MRFEFKSSSFLIYSSRSYLIFITSRLNKGVLLHKGYSQQAVLVWIDRISIRFVYKLQFTNLRNLDLQRKMTSHETIFNFSMFIFSSVTKAESLLESDTMLIKITSFLK